MKIAFNRFCFCFTISAKVEQKKTFKAIKKFSVVKLPGGLIKLMNLKRVKVSL